MPTTKVTKSSTKEELFKRVQQLEQQVVKLRIQNAKLKAKCTAMDDDEAEMLDMFRMARR